ncbi:TAT-binding protein-like protein 7, AAA ATPase [Cryptotrichosporon argae]
MGDPDTSDSDDLLTPSKMGGHRASLAAGANGPSADVLNFGRVNPKSNMADADPLGVDVNVTFDRVGGLDDHINQLKEMVALPLLYPELFQQFGITPPRGVLFHGPPGTGKTLLARALAASCSNGNTKIAFFMRKGADVLSKWVGEAERQLRMLFEEARASQPSIIFFDEIDGLAPVRSSKQDQIHASLVSTLLALMDGMDGRGQVIVIGATNRPDAVDPALRRPGRFDREFYFPLPNIDARRKIIGINTRSWDPALDDEVLDRLAVLTKGYGGADLRALCTEAALNAIQRRYPQIYRTSDRLLLEPKSIRVLLKDFMAAVKKIVPSSARSSSSAAIQLPTHLAPLLSAHLERIQTAVIRALPENKKRSALEEAEWEEDDGRFENEVMLQTLDKMRTFRPRVLVHGNAGMGQNYLGPAILHHLEGFHVQSLDLATLLGDSTRTPEAALVQLFTEAKRHQPSVIYLPSLAQWASTLTDTARSTARALLDSVPPSDPILVLAVMDGDVEDLPRDVQGWFGVRTGDRIELSSPDAAQRAAFFADVLACVTRPPTDFPDALPRRKRVLEALPLAPPLPPRKPTEAELARETERDLAARNMMQMSFNSLVAEFNKKYKRATAAIREEVMMRAAYEAEAAAELAAAASVPPTNGSAVDNDAPVSSSAPAALETVNQPEAANAAMALAAGAVEPEVAPARPAPKWTAHDVDVDTLHRRLVRHKYYTPQDFLDDVARIEENAIRSSDSQGQLRVLEMVGHARSHVATFDPKWTPEFERYKERMLKRKEERKRKGEDLKAQEEEARFANGADPEATAGDAAGADASAHDTAAEASKRPREESEESDEARKRQKGMNIDPVSPHSLTADPAVSSIPASLTPLSPLPSTATVPPPLPPVYPPFVVPSLDKLATLLARTDAFNVDELEALRAGWVDRVWRSRAEWDRTEVVQELEGMVTRLIGEVEGRRMCEVEVD